MFVHGTCNPAGESEDHDGVYLRESDIERIVREDQLVGKPVLMEHFDDTVAGHVVSAWKHDGQLDVLVKVDTEQLWGSMAGACVASKCLKEFSLGYKVQMSASGQGGATAACVGHKTLVELSLVKQGARANCQIKNFEV